MFHPEPVVSQFQFILSILSIRISIILMTMHRKTVLIKRIPAVPCHKETMAIRTVQEAWVF